MQAKTFYRRGTSNLAMASIEAYSEALRITRVCTTYAEALSLIYASSKAHETIGDMMSDEGRDSLATHYYDVAAELTLISWEFPCEPDIIRYWYSIGC